MDKDKYVKFLKGMSLLLALFALALFFVAHKKPVSDNKAESSRSQLLPRQKPATIQPAAIAPKRQRKKIVSFAPNASRAVSEENAGEDKQSLSIVVTRRRRGAESGRVELRLDRNERGRAEARPSQSCQSCKSCQKQPLCPCASV